MPEPELLPVGTKVLVEATIIAANYNELNYLVVPIQHPAWHNDVAFVVKSSDIKSIVSRPDQEPPIQEAK